MKTSVSLCDFRTAFYQYNRKDNFTYNGLAALYNYLEDLGDDSGEEVELDVIALCCDFTEYASAYEAMQQYQPEDMPVEGEEGDDLIEIQEKEEEEARRWLEERTSVIDVDKGRVIIQDF